MSEKADVIEGDVADINYSSLAPVNGFISIAPLQGSTPPGVQLTSVLATWQQLLLMYCLVTR